MRFGLEYYAGWTAVFCGLDWSYLQEGAVAKQRRIVLYRHYSEFDSTHSHFPTQGLA